MVRVSKPTQTATERGKAKLCILDFKITWSEFQSPVRPLPSKAKPSYVYSILKPHIQSSKSPVRLLSREAKQSYVYTILKKHNLSRVGPKQLCALAHQGSTREAGTFQLTINTPLFSLIYHYFQIFLLLTCIKSVNTSRKESQVIYSHRL